MGLTEQEREILVGLKVEKSDKTPTTLLIWKERMYCRKWNMQKPSYGQ